MASKANDENKEAEQPFMKKKKTNIIKIVFKIIEKLIMIAIIFISIIILTQKLTNNDKAFLGFRIFRVQTGSMTPVYNVGDVILVKERDLGKIKVGDDVTYWGTTGVMKGKLVTHRVVDIGELNGERVFYTQGVANTKMDPEVFDEQINGVVMGKLYVLTAITLGLANQYVFYFCGIIPLTLFVFFDFV